MKKARREDYIGERFAVRLERFGGRVLVICDQLPKSKAGRHVEDQLVRSATAIGAHYSEAQGGQSKKDFVHKVSLALKEAREARYWLGVARYANYADGEQLLLLQREATEIIAILQASQNKSRSRSD